MSSKKLSINDLHNLNHYYLNKLDYLDFRYHSKFELDFINRQLKACLDSIKDFLD